MEVGAEKEVENKDLEDEGAPADDFEGAFDEAVEADSGEKEPPTEEAEELEGEAEEKPTPEESEEEEIEEEAEEKPKEEEEAALGEGGEEEAEEGETLEKVQHKYKTVSGMYDSEVLKRKNAEDELALLKAGKQPSPKEEETEKPEDKKEVALDVSSLTKTIQESESFKALGDEYGEEMTTALTDMAANIAKTVIGDVIHKVNGKFDQFSEILNPLQTSYAEAEGKTHFDALTEAHSDYKKHVDSGELEEWINGQPNYKRKMYTEVYDEGEVGDVIDLFTTFKTAKGYTEPEKEEKETPAPKKKINKTKLEDMEVVDTKKSPVSGVKGAAAKNDFEGAWEEA